MIKHEHQRVGVFIDVQNMYYTAKKIWNSRVDFGNILETAVAGRQYIRGIAYVVEATGDEKPFFEALHQRGLETKMREVTVFASGAKKADWDVGMAVDAIRIGEILDVVVLVTGDGDFVELVEYLRHHGRQVEVIAFKETTSAKLIDAADDYTNLSDDLGRFLIRPHRRQNAEPEAKTSVAVPPETEKGHPAQPARAPKGNHPRNSR
ncbi:NYN domain-containing protein [Candidatus Uhrbacteria bacterium]|nr:NYN domain-containing protein [Candidatus Uhrbacteria bacterium]